MKVFKLTISIVNHDALESREIIDVIENTKYPNYCISPRVIDIKEADIGECSDDHPLNFVATSYEAFHSLFGGSQNARIAELEAELSAWRSELLAATGGHATTPKLAAEIVRQLRNEMDAAKGTK